MEVLISFAHLANWPKCAIFSEWTIIMMRSILILKIRKAVLSGPSESKEICWSQKEVVLIGCGYIIEILESRIWEKVLEEKKVLQQNF